MVRLHDSLLVFVRRKRPHTTRLASAGPSNRALYLVMRPAPRSSPRLKPRPSEEIRAEVRELNARRKDAQPTNKRTFGSVFKNPAHELSAGRMLDGCGLKGFAIGGACISPKHANFIENAGGAITADALALMAEARRRAHEEFGVVLEHEVEFLGDLSLPAL